MAEISGTVSLRLLGLPGCNAHVRLSSGDRHRVSAVGPPWQQELSLEGALCEAAAPRVLVQLLDPKTKQELAKVEMHVAGSVEKAGEWSALRVLDFGQGRLLLTKVMWQPIDREAYVLLKYVRKIQAVWRGRRARKHLDVLKREHKLLGRKGVESNGSLYLVSCYAASAGVELQLHSASAETARPLLHSLSVADTEATAALSSVQVSAEQTLIA